MLYRFFPDNQYSLSSLANCYLWFSDVGDFNDPFEAHINDTLKYENIAEVEDNVFINELKSQGHQNLDPVEQEIYLLNLAMTDQTRYKKLKNEVLNIAKKRHLGVFEKYSMFKWCCFSEDNEEFGSPIHRKLMWGHYANGLRGFLVEFDKKALIESLTQSLQLNNPNSYIINAPINYCNLAPIPFYNEFISKIRRSERLFDFLTQKSLEWRYETECRLGSPEQQVNFGVNAVQRIIIGEKMSHDFRNMLLILIKSIMPKVEIFEAFIDTEDFQIKTKRLLE
ncbi:TPA: DUF2971 domain-containing protein [Vibrio cholerae]